MDIVPRSPNNLLSSLSLADFDLLRPNLQHIEMVHEAVLARAGDMLARVYFPHSGIISLVLGLADGESVKSLPSATLFRGQCRL
jgi:hypothetical protein